MGENWLPAAGGEHHHHDHTLGQPYTCVLCAARGIWLVHAYILHGTLGSEAIVLFRNALVPAGVT